jgi:protocatechuate 3,4-dioxygenase beta subunit
MIRFLAFALISLMLPKSILAQEPIIGGPCQGCEFVFVGMPDQLYSHSRIAQIGEQGEALVLMGTVYNAGGTPASDVIIYAYQTDANGEYPKGSTWHGKLRGWVRTDQNGRYRFETIRPGTYPGSDTAQHIHMHIIEPNKATYFIDNITFDDDPVLNDNERERQNCRGGCGTSFPKRNAQGVWHVRRDITLGEAIPNYK